MLGPFCHPSLDCTERQTMAAHRVQWFKALPPLVRDELSRGSLCHSERLRLELIESSSQPARALKVCLSAHCPWLAGHFSS